MNDKLAYAYRKDYVDTLKVADPTILAVPEHVKMTHARCAEWEPAEDDILFRSGNIIQRILFYQEPQQWDEIESNHLLGFHTYLRDKFGEENLLPKEMPTEELVRALHASGFDYKLCYQEILHQN